MAIFLNMDSIYVHKITKREFKVSKLNDSIELFSTDGKKHLVVNAEDFEKNYSRLD